MRRVNTKTEVSETYGEQPHSVKFGITSRGKWSAEVKTYAATPDEALQQSSRIAATVEAILKEKNQEVEKNGNSSNISDT